MRINHNIMALNAYRQLSVNNVGVQKSLEKLSSGLRINRAGDDAAGLAISEKMRGQIRGLEQASRNAQDAISLIQTAEGALNETHAILQRMRELVVQAGTTGTNQSEDLQALQDEIKALIEEIDGIGERTQFNGKTLLDGTYAVDTSGTGGTRYRRTSGIGGARITSGASGASGESGTGGTGSPAGAGITGSASVAKGLVFRLVRIQIRILLEYRYDDDIGFGSKWRTYHCQYRCHKFCKFSPSI